ncbi:hypothetical protein ES703_22999 [subsurface metagenome]
MGNTIDLTDTDCQIVNYRYDLNTHVRHAYIEKDRHLVEAVGSRLPFEPLDTFYWLENQNDGNLRREDLRLDAEVMDNGHVLMEVHPGLFRHPEVIDLESVWFGIKCKALRQDGVFTLGEIEFILVMAFLKGDLLPRIRAGKLVIIDPALVEKDRPGPGEKKAVATAPKKRAKVRRLKVAPHDCVKYAKEKGAKKSSVVIFRALYRGSWWGNSSKLWVWHEPKHRDGRWNTGGLAGLVDRTGFCDKWVGKRLKELQDIGVIYKRAHGRKGVTNTIWELPKEKPHVMAWKRRPKKRKK